MAQDDATEQAPAREGLDRTDLASLMLAGAIAGGIAWTCYVGVPISTRMIAVERALANLTEEERSSGKLLDDLQAEVERLAGVVAAGVPAPQATLSPADPSVTAPDPEEVVGICRNPCLYEAVAEDGSVIRFNCGGIHSKPIGTFVPAETVTPEETERR